MLKKGRLLRAELSVLAAHCWIRRDVPEPRPAPRYGQSQLRLRDDRLLVLGGCGGPNNVFSDVWYVGWDSSESQLTSF